MKIINKLKEIYVNRLLYKKSPSKFKKTALVFIDDMDIALIVTSIIWILLGEFSKGSVMYLSSMGLFVVYIFLNMHVYAVRPVTQTLPDLLDLLLRCHIITAYDSKQKFLRKLVAQGSSKTGHKGQPDSLFQRINRNALLTTIVGGVIVWLVTENADAIKGPLVSAIASGEGTSQVLAVLFLIIMIAIAGLMIFLLLYTYTNNRFEDQYFQSDMEDILHIIESGKDVEDICTRLEDEENSEDSAGQSKADEDGSEEAQQHDDKEQEKGNSEDKDE